MLRKSRHRQKKGFLIKKRAIWNFGKIVVKFFLRIHFLSRYDNAKIKRLINRGAIQNVCYLHNAVFHCIHLRPTFSIFLCYLPCDITSPVLAVRSLSYAIFYRFFPLLSPFRLLQFYLEKKCCLTKWWGGWWSGHPASLPPPSSLIVYGPVFNSANDNTFYTIDKLKLSLQNKSLSL